MSMLQQALADYLSIRRALGYKLERAGKLLAQFVDHLDAAGVSTVTVEHAVAWATLPASADGYWWAYRLSVVRGFTRYLAGIDEATEVPPTDLLPWRKRRATPYLYSDDEVVALLAATVILRTPLRKATYRTLLGLLAVTGMRIGEAIALDRDDLDVRHELLVVRSGKFGKSREVVLHPTTIEALVGYLQQRDQFHPRPSTPALFINNAGKRLRYDGVHATFKRLVDRAGLTPRSAACRPRPHDLRHSFAVNSLLDAYRTGVDVAARLPLLSTYLGHVHPSGTYWYLSAAPELLALAGQRLEDHLGARP